MFTHVAINKCSNMHVVAISAVTVVQPPFLWNAHAAEFILHTISYLNTPVAVHAAAVNARTD